MKNKLQENMKRFGTKNLSEQIKGMDIAAAELADGNTPEEILQNIIDALSATGAGASAGNAAGIVSLVNELEKTGKIGKEMATIILSVMPLTKTPLQSIKFGLEIGKMGAQNVMSIAKMFEKFMK